MTFAFGYDMEPKFNTDYLGWTYIALAAAWTVCLLAGMGFLLLNRRLLYLRIRNIPLSISAVATLHVYWCLCMSAYMVNGFFPCATEFWIMSIYLPLGIALYQASNTQLLHVAGLQRRFLIQDAMSVRKSTDSPARSRCTTVNKWKSYSVTRKAMSCIAVGMIAQVFCSTVVFLTSRKFHADWGLTGHSVDKLTCRRGWEWWPSIIWQFTWAWLYAPYLLYKVRDIEDVHCWRLQTVMCSIAGLPATPMWLIALYVPRFKSINKYFVPPLWFSACIVVMEASVVFMPCWQVLMNRRLKKETLQIIADWEEKQRSNTSIASGSTKVCRQSILSHKPSMNSTASSRRGELYTMNALEKALETNATPLLLFAALKDFSGENVSFLNHVRDWKAGWSPPLTRQGILKRSESNKSEGAALRRQQFNLAVEIYSSFVSLQSSDFPINLSSAHHKDLEALFDSAAALVNANTPNNAVTPFNSHWSSKRSLDLEASPSIDHLSVVSTIINKSTDEIIREGSPQRKHNSVKLADLRTRIPDWIQVPEEFSPRVFDDAEESIKYMVLTNTWPKFVAAGYASSQQQKGFGERCLHVVSNYVEKCTGQWHRLCRT